MAIYQYDADANLVYLCDCGGGLDDAFRAEFTSPEDFPIVAEVEYAERTFTASGDKTNALTHPRVVRVRHDKSADECVEEKLTYGEKG
jgi:ATP-dependent DNA ligase